MKLFNSILVGLIGIVCLAGCKKNLPEPEFPVNTNFVSATMVGTFNKSDLDAKAVKAGFGSFTALTNYSVDYYRIIYKTKYKDNDIQVSGLVGIPKNLPKAPSLLSVHHAEITRFSDAPSNFPASFNGIEMFASAGFIEMIPDYIGLGVSSAIPQPLYHKDYSPLTAIDMVKATKYFLERKKIAYNSKLFLAGYSEGGFVTASMQKILDTDSSHKLKVTASAEGGGLLMFSQYPQHRNPGASLKSTTPYFVPMLIHGYYATYDWTRPLTEYFSPALAMRFDALFDGTKTTDQISSEILSSPQDFQFSSHFQQYPQFGASLNFPEFTSAISGNNLTYSRFGYVPKAPTRFYLDTPDYISTSLLIYVVDGISYPEVSNVKFLTIDRTIPSTGQPMFLDIMQWFIGLDK